MTEHGLLALVAVVFLVTATLSGGVTVAVLSDSESVTTVIELGNAAAGNAPTGAGNAPDRANGSTAGTAEAADASATGNETAISTTGNESEDATVAIAIEPAARTVDAGDETTYEVVVTGATDGVSSYDLTVRLSNSSVATFETFAQTAGSAAVVQNATDDELDVSVGLVDPVDGSGEVVLGSVTVTGTAAGQTDLALVSESDGSLDGAVTDGDPTDPTHYEVTVADGGTLTVESRNTTG